MKILHTADLHLREKDIEEASQCLRFLIGKARDENIDLAIIAGDIFDSRDVKLDSKAAKLAVKTISTLANIAPVAVVLGTNSHDGAAPEVLQYARGAYPVIVAATPIQIKAIKKHSCFYRIENPSNGNPDAIISLIPQPTKQFFNVGDIQSSNEAISHGMSGLFAGVGAQADGYSCPHLLVYHGSISGAKLSNQQVLAGMDIEVSTDQLRLSNANIIMCGHLHLPQELPGNVFYSGSIYANNWGEDHKHGFYIHTLEGKKLVSSEFVETPCRKLVRFQHDLTDDFNGYALADRMSLEADKAIASFVRLDLTVWQDEAAKIDKETIKQIYLTFGALDVDIRIIRVPRQTVRSESVLKVVTLRDKLIAMAALSNEEVPERILAKADELESGQIEEMRAA